MKLLYSLLLIFALVAVSLAVPDPEADPQRGFGWGGFGGYRGFGGYGGGFGGYRGGFGGRWGREGGWWGR